MSDTMTIRFFFFSE